MMKTKLLNLITMAMLLVSPTCFSYACTGAVSYLAIAADGAVWVEIANSTARHTICNIQTRGSYGITEASCKTVYATLLAAKIAKQNVGIYYDYYSTTGLTCATMVTPLKAVYTVYEVGLI
jgi:hypothetical protein